jgi:ADP-ribosylglycohydrolase
MPWIGAVIEAALGDAMGTNLEFKSEEKIKDDI